MVSMGSECCRETGGRARVWSPFIVKKVTYCNGGAIEGGDGSVHEKGSVSEQHAGLSTNKKAENMNLFNRIGTLAARENEDQTLRYYMSKFGLSRSRYKGVYFEGRLHSLEDVRNIALSCYKGGGDGKRLLEALVAGKRVWYNVPLRIGDHELIELGKSMQSVFLLNGALNYGQLLWDGTSTSVRAGVDWIKIINELPDVMLQGKVAKCILPLISDQIKDFSSLSKYEGSINPLLEQLFVANFGQKGQLADLCSLFTSISAYRELTDNDVELFVDAAFSNSPPVLAIRAVKDTVLAINNPEVVKQVGDQCLLYSGKRKMMGNASVVKQVLKMYSANGLKPDSFLYLRCADACAKSSNSDALHYLNLGRQIAGGEDDFREKTIPIYAKILQSYTFSRRKNFDDFVVAMEAIGALGLNTHLDCILPLLRDKEIFRNRDMLGVVGDSFLKSWENATDPFTELVPSLSQNEPHCIRRMLLPVLLSKPEGIPIAEEFVKMGIWSPKDSNFHLKVDFQKILYQVTDVLDKKSFWTAVADNDFEGRVCEAICSGSAAKNVTSRNIASYVCDGVLQRIENGDTRFDARVKNAVRVSKLKLVYNSEKNADLSCQELKELKNDLVHEGFVQYYEHRARKGFFDSWEDIVSEGNEWGMNTENPLLRAVQLLHVNPKTFADNQDKIFETFVWFWKTDNVKHLQAKHVRFLFELSKPGGFQYANKRLKKAITNLIVVFPQIANSSAFWIDFLDFNARQKNAVFSVLLGIKGSFLQNRALVKASEVILERVKVDKLYNGLKSSLDFHHFWSSFNALDEESQSLVQNLDSPVLDDSFANSMGVFKICPLTVLSHIADSPELVQKMSHLDKAKVYENWMRALYLAEDLSGAKYAFLKSFETNAGKTLIFLDRIFRLAVRKRDFEFAHYVFKYMNEVGACTEMASRGKFTKLALYAIQHSGNQGQEAFVSELAEVAFGLASAKDQESISDHLRRYCSIDPLGLVRGGYKQGTNVLFDVSGSMSNKEQSMSKVRTSQTVPVAPEKDSLWRPRFLDSARQKNIFTANHIFYYC
eukprot:Nk52_evm10s256 gene=Nk52_evmTU10s256